VEWKPITKKALQDCIRQGVARTSVDERNLWRTIEMEPPKWALHAHGDAGGGFWAVGLIGGTVVWYNDLEEGFNRSEFSKFGTIDDYFGNHDELEVTVQFFANSIAAGVDLVRLSTRTSKRRPKR
jgi:hypothetical protein